MDLFVVGQHDLLRQFPFQNMPEIHALPSPATSVSTAAIIYPGHRGLQSKLHKYLPNPVSTWALSPPPTGLHLKPFHVFPQHWKPNPDSTPGHRHHWILSNARAPLSDLTHRVYSSLTSFPLGAFAPPAASRRRAFRLHFSLYHPLSQPVVCSFITLQVSKPPLRFVYLAAPASSLSLPLEQKSPEDSDQDVCCFIHSILNVHIERSRNIC